MEKKDRTITQNHINTNNSHPSLFPRGPDSVALAARLLGALNTNSHELEEMGPGSGLFLLASLCEHSCLPNCAFR